ncbi:hypothetical protein BJ508DRAFT_301617 [Ascobolus immersus RN42]|uniref:Uncharacterized protein n=1 Tax=Ascobolus immersus RN42 TaxID=1160509 RepID=A0A3N4IKY4_ASCIM|nr:hypothetical protein BJ508DRAFT_301617 [Ascobolus immersus RN42]
MHDLITRMLCCNTPVEFKSESSIFDPNSPTSSTSPASMVSPVSPKSPVSPASPSSPATPAPQAFPPLLTCPAYQPSQAFLSSPLTPFSPASPAPKPCLHAPCPHYHPTDTLDSNTAFHPCPDSNCNMMFCGPCLALNTSNTQGFFEHDNNFVQTPVEKEDRYENRVRGMGKDKVKEARRSSRFFP